VVLTIQFLLGVYGGYFGGAVGLMMMAVWSLLAGADIKALNPHRTIMVTAANTVALISFIVAGVVCGGRRSRSRPVRSSAAMAARCSASGCPPRWSGAATLVVAAAITALFFLRAYGRHLAEHDLFRKPLHTFRDHALRPLERIEQLPPVAFRHRWPAMP
jgi:hypothetical protein